jgi:hypothetical protein
MGRAGTRGPLSAYRFGTGPARAGLGRGWGGPAPPLQAQAQSQRFRPHPPCGISLGPPGRLRLFPMHLQAVRARAHPSYLLSLCVACPRAHAPLQLETGVSIVRTLDTPVSSTSISPGDFLFLAPTTTIQEELRLHL